VRLLILIPAYNEAANLAAVIADVRAHASDADVLIVDDGSEDDTARVAGQLGIRCLTLPKRIGVSGAVRTGLRYALAHGYEVVVRLDGDGQHPAALVSTLAGTLERERADLVVGSRYKTRRRPQSVPFMRRLMHYTLGRLLSHVVGRLVTDPTSGLWAFGSTAIESLARRHPSGYPEAELILVASRLRLRLVEAPVDMRERLAGTTSLTLRRSVAAMLKLALRLASGPLSLAHQTDIDERRIEDAALRQAGIGETLPSPQDAPEPDLLAS